ncbi:MAG: hypothetical protein PHV17_06505 [Candidatus Omnitrophica bacterium]|jgi:hypothetical protein|nr:hypothetical protein [Candidatus Omnitrophota bacterium]MDD5070363.1 hypothetical protein [Candidatus Omnitrophota bacterium]
MPGDPNDKINIVGKISERIGTGAHAQTAIVWETIIVSFVVGCFLTLAVLIAAWLKIITVSMEDIKILWSTVFVPIITVSLGYIFGRGKQ